MEIRVLGCHGSQLPGFGLTGFLIDGETLLDAGAVTSVLTLAEQARIARVLITHAHLDHTRELTTLAENLCFLKQVRPLEVLAPAEVIASLRAHLFNNVLWPDFSVLPTPERPVLRFVPLTPGRSVGVGPLTIQAITVHHTIEAVGYRVSAADGHGGEVAVVFVGDSGPTDEIWAVAGREKGLRALFVETSFPEGMRGMAARSGHLTPEGLAKELQKLGPRRPRVYLYHMKLPFCDEIQREVCSLGDDRIQLLRDGQIIRI